MIQQVLFLFLAIVAIVSALGAVLARSPINSAMWMVLNLIAVAGLYITLNALFIGVLQVLVYAGAIMVLILFVIMLLNLGSMPAPAEVQWKHVVAFMLGVALLTQLTFVLAMGLDALPELAVSEDAVAASSAGEIGKMLFTRYALPFEIIAILLLAATIGAVMLAKRKLA